LADLHARHQCTTRNNKLLGLNAYNSVLYIIYIEEFSVVLQARYQCTRQLFYTVSCAP